MKEDIKNRWVAKLAENGPQANGALTRLHEDGTEADCCLGVLCKIAMEDGIVARAAQSSAAVAEFTYWDVNDPADSNSGTLPIVVQEWAGLAGEEGMFTVESGLRFKGTPADRIHESEIIALTSLNDHLKWDLATIGRFIEEHWEVL